jgi:hypothetical protein
MSNIELIPVFGSSFLIYVPIIMIIVSLLTLFNGYAKLFRFFGVETEEASTSHIFSCKKLELVDEELEQYNSGKAIVSSEMKRLNQLDSQQDISKLTGSDKSMNERRNRHEVQMGRQKNSDIEEAKKNALFSVQGSSNNKGKYHPQKIVEDDMAEVDEDDDIETFTFSNVPIDSNSSHSLSNSAHTSVPSFSSWKIFGGGSGGLLPSFLTGAGSAYNRADKPTAASNSDEEVNNPIRSGPRANVSQVRVKDDSRPRPKPPTSSINFSIEDEEDDDYSRGRYSGL